MTAAVGTAPLNEQRKNGAHSLFYVECKINEKIVKFLIDTGSALTIIPKVLASRIEPSHLQLSAANGSSIKNFCQTKLP